MQFDIDTQRAKTIARAVSSRCKTAGSDIAYGQALDGLAAGLGYTDWNHLSAALKQAEQPAFTLKPYDVSWLWSGASEPNGFAESACLTADSARELQRMLETFGDLTGEIDRISVAPAPAPDGDPVGVEAPLSALKHDLQAAGILEPDAFDAVVADVRAQHGTPQPEADARQRTLIAYQLDPEGARRFDDAHIFYEDHARLSAAERTFLQTVMDVVAALDAVTDRLFDICVAEQRGSVPQPIASSDDGLADAVSKLSDYFAQNCPGDRIPDQMRKAFGRYTCQEAIDLHQARWGR